MAFKKLSDFVFFDFQKFMEGKTLKAIGIEPWNDFESKAELGTKITTIIERDQTQYTLKKGEQVSNLYEKLTFKVSGKVNNVAIGDTVLPINPIAKVYGEYRNQLSVKCDGMKVLQRQQGVR